MDEYIQSLTIPTITADDQARCDQDITVEELASAIKLLNNDSAPGSDGLPAEFYKVFWLQIKAPLLACFKYGFESNSLSSSERLGIISLFHKGKDLLADNLDNWRPLSLTNVDYKIIAKVLSLRLDTVIEDIIGEQQVGFMKGRDISSVHRRINDIMELQKKKKKV